MLLKVTNEDWRMTKKFNFRNLVVNLDQGDYLFLKSLILTLNIFS